MIRVELVYEHRSAWGALAQRWGAVLLGIVAACALLYLLPVNRWLADHSPAPPVVALEVEEGLPDEEAMPAPVPQEAPVVQQQQPAADVEPTAAIDGAVEVDAIVLPPIGEAAPLDEVASVGQVPASDEVASVAEAAPLEEAEPGAAPSVTTACFSAVAVASNMPAEGQLGLVSCLGDGRYELSGTVESQRALVAVEAALTNELDAAAFSSERAGAGALHFFIAGRRASSRTVSLATLAQAQARAFFARVEYWADLCGIDDIALGEVSEIPVDGQRRRWRRRLVGTGSYSQIDALLARMATAGETAGLAELILTPVSGAGGRDRAVRLSGAVDIVVHR